MSSIEEERIIDGEDREEDVVVVEDQNWPPAVEAKLETIAVTVCLLCINIIMIILVFLLPVLCRPDQNMDCAVEPFSILIYAHTIYWTLHLVADQYLKQHHRRHRVKGFVEFYASTKNIRRAPFYIVSFGNAVLLITVTALHDYCDKDTSMCYNKFTKVDCLRGLVTLECMIIICLWVRYIIHVKEFNRTKPLPDLYRKTYIDAICNAVEDARPCFEAAEEKNLLDRQSQLILHIHNVVTKNNVQ